MPQIRHFPGVNSVTNIEPGRGVMPVTIIGNMRRNEKQIEIFLIPRTPIKGISRHLRLESLQSGLTC